MKRFKFLIVLLILLILPIASCSIGETSTTNKNYPATSSTTSSTNDSGHSLNNVKLEDKVFVYDGKVHSLEVTNLPKGYTIIYINNFQSKVGEYEVIAQIMAGEVKVKELKATLSIIGDDSFSISFPNVSSVYTGEVVSAHIIGELPNDVSVTYVNNQNVKAGTYTVTALFSNGSKYGLTQMNATVTILPYDLSKNKPVFKNTFEYDGQPHQISLLTALPKGISINAVGNSQTEIGEKNVNLSYEIEQGYESCFLNYDPFSVKLTVIGSVSERVLTNIEINTSNMDKTLLEPETLNLDNLIVFNVYNNGEKVKTTNYIVKYYLNNVEVSEFNQTAQYTVRIISALNSNLYQEFAITYQKKSVSPDNPDTPITDPYDLSNLAKASLYDNLMVSYSNDSIIVNTIDKYDLVKIKFTIDNQIIEDTKLPLSITKDNILDYSIKIEGYIGIDKVLYKIEKDVSVNNNVKSSLEKAAAIIVNDTVDNISANSLSISVDKFLELSPEGYKLYSFSVYDSNEVLINTVLYDGSETVYINGLNADQEYDIRPEYRKILNNNLNMLQYVSKDEYSITFVGFFYRTGKNINYRIRGYYNDTIIYTYFVDKGASISNSDFENVILPKSLSHLTFVGLLNGTVNNISSDLDLEIVYIDKTKTSGPFKVVFVSHDKTILKVDNVNYGQSASAPSGEGLDYETYSYKYTFSGWSNTFDNIEAEQVIYAKYDYVAKKDPGIKVNIYNVTNKIVFYYSSHIASVSEIKVYDQSNSPVDFVRMVEYYYFITTPQTYKIMIDYSYKLSSASEVVKKNVTLDIVAHAIEEDNKLEIMELDYFGARFKPKKGQYFGLLSESDFEMPPYTYRYFVAVENEPNSLKINNVQCQFVYDIFKRVNKDYDANDNVITVNYSEGYLAYKNFRSLECDDVFKLKPDLNYQYQQHEISSMGNFIIVLEQDRAIDTTVSISLFGSGYVKETQADYVNYDSLPTYSNDDKTLTIELMPFMDNPNYDYLIVFDNCRLALRHGDYQFDASIWFEMKFEPQRLVYVNR